MERSTADTKERSPVSHHVESSRPSITTVSLQTIWSDSGCGRHSLTHVTRGDLYGVTVEIVGKTTLISESNILQLCFRTVRRYQDATNE